MSAGRRLALVLPLLLAAQPDPDAEVQRLQRKLSEAHERIGKLEKQLRDARDAIDVHEGKLAEAVAERDAALKMLDPQALARDFAALSVAWFDAVGKHQPDPRQRERLFRDLSAALQTWRDESPRTRDKLADELRAPLRRLRESAAADAGDDAESLFRRVGADAVVIEQLLSNVDRAEQARRIGRLKGTPVEWTGTIVETKYPGFPLLDTRGVSVRLDGGNQQVPDGSRVRPVRVGDDVRVKGRISIVKCEEYLNVTMVFTTLLVDEIRLDE